MGSRSVAEADAEPTWRSYMTCVEDALPASILLGIEIPQNGGDTFFADQRAALASLTDQLLRLSLCSNFHLLERKSGAACQCFIF